MEISCESDLEQIKTTSEVDLTADITISEDFEPIESFSGTFNGNGFIVKDLSNYFIKNIESEGEIQNINFKDVTLTTQKGIFKENNGLIKSITLSNLEYIGDSAVGSIVFQNNNTVRSCTVIDSVIDSTEHTVGGICAKSSEDSLISNCTVKDSVLSGNTNVGGISGKITDSIIEDCDVTAVTISGLDCISGIVGTSKSSSLVNCSVKNSDISGDSSISGFSSSSYDIIIKNCLVKDSTYIANNHIRLFSDLNSRDTKSKILSSSVQDCSVTTASGSAEIDLFAENSSSEQTVKNSFINNTTLTEERSILCDGDIEITNSYVELTLISSSPRIETYDSDSFYTNISETSPEEKTTVTVSTENQLKQINENDTVILNSDISISDEFNFKIDRFTGTFDGNGYTISNLSDSLFNYLSGTMKDLTIKESFIDYQDRGFIAHRIENATIDNITVKADSEVYTYKTTFYSIGRVVKNSIISNCTILAHIKEGSCYGISRKIRNTDVMSCLVSLTVENGENCAGISRTSMHPIDISTFKNCTVTGTISAKRCSGFIFRSNGELVNCTSDVDISLSSSEHTIYENLSLIGGLVGKTHIESSISNCKFTGKISVEQGSEIECIGGLVGMLNDGEIENSVNTGKLLVPDTMTVGGVAGISRSKIMKCINNGIIIGGNTTGGLVGLLGDSGSVTTSRNLAQIKGSEKQTGGLAGKVNSGCSIIDSYNNSLVEPELEDTLIGTSGDTVSMKNLHLIPVNDSQTTNCGQISTVTPKELNIILNL